MSYVVRVGDSLSNIAKNKLGDVNRWQEIARLNNIPAPYSIYPGLEISLPGAGFFDGFINRLKVGLKIIPFMFVKKLNPAADVQQKFDIPGKISGFFGGFFTKLLLGVFAVFLGFILIMTVTKAFVNKAVG